MDLDEETIIITNDDGTEKEYTILFTFESEDTGKSYVLYYDENDPEQMVEAMIYHDDALEEITSEEEWNMIEEVFNTFMSEDDEEAVEE